MSLIKEKAIMSMKDYFNGDLNQINHALKVLNYAEEIYHGENLKDNYLYNVIILTTAFHDIGIPEAIKKHGSAHPKYQELEGGPIARKLMEDLNIRKDILERVCYIISNHHSKDKIDSLDFQIQWEADLIVNLEEGWSGIDKVSLKENLEDHFKTSTGIKLVSKLL